MKSKMCYPPLKSIPIIATFFLQLVSGQRPAAEDTWILINTDRYVLTYTVTLPQEPHVSWWWRSTAQDSKFEALQHTSRFHESVRPIPDQYSGGRMSYDIRLEISNINSSIFGEYKVEIDGDDELTRYFTVNEMPEQKSLDGLIEPPAASGEEDKFELSKSQVYIAVSVASGILLVVALIAIALVIRIKTKKQGRRPSSGDIQPDNISGGLSISSHHYTDVHSNAGYEGLGEKQDTHEYLTTSNTTANRGAYNDPAHHKPLKPPTQKPSSFANKMYGDSNQIIRPGINPASLLKPVPKIKYKKKQNKGRHFSDSTSDREDSATYENVAKVGSNYQNCNNLKRTKSAQ